MGCTPKSNSFVDRPPVLRFPLVGTYFVKELFLNPFNLWGRSFWTMPKYDQLMSAFKDVQKDHPCLGWISRFPRKWFWMFQECSCEFAGKYYLHRFTWDFTWFYPLVNKHNYGKSPFLMGKSTISMAIFNSYVIYQRVASYLCGFCRFANPAILRILVASIRQQQRFASIRWNQGTPRGKPCRSCRTGVRTRFHLVGGLEPWLLFSIIYGI